MRVSFTLRGFSSSFDLSRIVRSDRRFVDIRRRMVDELNIPEVRANRILEDMLGRALLRHGEHLVATKSALVDRVITLRGQLDTLYSSALNFRARTGKGQRIDSSVSSIDDQLRQIDQAYKQLDDELAKLGKPFHEIEPPPNLADDIPDRLTNEVAANPATGPRPAERPITHDTTPQGASRRVRIQSGRYRFKRRTTSDGRTVWERSFDSDGSKVQFEVRNGRYHVETFDAQGQRTAKFQEYDILHDAYGRRPRTSAIIQAHHGLQDALMRRLFGKFQYNGNAAPTIWLRNSRRGSPHGMITAVQNSQKSSRNVAGLNFAQIRQWAIEDLRLTQMPEVKIKEYIAAFDHYFETTVLPNINAANMTAAQRQALLGNWKPGLGL